VDTKISLKDAIIGPYSPVGNVNYVWIFMYSMATIWETLMVPMQLAFDTSNFRTYNSSEETLLKNIEHVELGVLIFFLLDIIFKFNLAYIDDETNEVRDRAKIRKRYLTVSNFGIDLFISFPYNYFKATKFMAPLRLLRLTRIN
jgi:hypothetical protein